MAADDLTIVLADDQDLVRAGFRVILESEPGFRVVGEARDGDEAVECDGQTRTLREWLALVGARTEAVRSRSETA